MSIVNPPPPSPHYLIPFFHRYATPALTVGILASAIAKLASLHTRELWLDETRSAFIATLPFPNLLRYCAGDTSPPLYHVLLWIWVRVFGDFQAQLRLSSVLLSLLATAGVYVAARRWLASRCAAAFAACLFSFVPALFTYSLEVRPYALLVCCVAWLLVIHHSVAMEKRQSPAHLVAYALGGAALYYVHYVGTFILAALLLDWLITARIARRPTRPVFLVAFASLLLMAPWFPFMLRQQTLMHGVLSARAAAADDATSLSFNAPLTNDTDVAAITYVVADAGFLPIRPLPLAAALALPLFAAFAAMALLLIRGDRVCRLFVLIVAVTAAGLILLHMNESRYLMGLMPPLCLALARTAQFYFHRRRPKIGLFLGILPLSIYAAGFARQMTMPHPNSWTHAVAAVQSRYAPGDVVVFDALYGQTPFDYNAKQTGFSPSEDGFPKSIVQWWSEQPVKVWGSPVLRQPDLTATVARTIAHARNGVIFLVLFDVNYYDPYDRLLARFADLGQPELLYREIPTAVHAEQNDKGLRVYRITLKPNTAVAATARNESKWEPTKPKTTPTSPEAGF